MLRRINLRKVSDQKVENKLNIFFKGNFNFSSELIILSSLLDKYPDENSYCYNKKGESRYSYVKELCKEKTNLVENPELADIFVLPYKFKNIKDITFKTLEDLSLKYDKKLLCFYNDDNDENFNLNKNTILYRTSYYRKKSLINTRGMIAYSCDHFENNILQKPVLSIGYCGHIQSGREKYLKLLSNSKLSTDFILRNGFWAEGVDKQTAVKEYFENMKQNLFIFCYRGGGNFSYRFYETLMMGRIPILIDTDCLFPFDDRVNIKDLGLIVDEKDLDDKNLVQIIEEYYKNNLSKFEYTQKNNRKIWEDYFSPYGFVNNLIKTYIPEPPKIFASFTQTYGNERLIEIECLKRDIIGQRLRKNCDIIIFSFHNSGKEFIDKSKKIITGVYGDNVIFLEHKCDYLTSLRNSIVSMEEMNITDIVYIQDDMFGLNNKKNLKNLNKIDELFNFYNLFNIQLLFLYGDIRKEILGKVNYEKTVKWKNSQFFCFNTKKFGRSTGHGWGDGVKIINLQLFKKINLLHNKNNVWDIEACLSKYFTRNNIVDRWEQDGEFFRSSNIHGKNITKTSLEENLKRFFP